MLYVMVAGLGLWTLSCAYAGFQRRIGLFVVVVIAGMLLNTVWMIVGLSAKPLSPPALQAHLGALICAVAAFGGGWLLGLLVRGFRESRVDAP